MKNFWSWKLFRIAGIDVSVHLTFVLLLVVLGIAYGAASVILVTAIFGCVLLHELGHALTARGFGIQTKGILLLPIGGVAQLERIPRNPVQELVIAVAGPAVNVVLAVLFSALVVILYGIESFQTEAADPSLLTRIDVQPFLASLAAINVVLFCFNLIPAFPMDGGRVLRALLALQLDYVRATQIAARIGQVLAVTCGLIYLFFPHQLGQNPILLLIALFVYIGAGLEATSVERKHQFAGRTVAAAMMTRFDTVTPEEPLSTVLERLKTSAQSDFPVVRDGELFGILQKNALLRAVAKLGPSFTVADVPFEATDGIAADAPLEEAYEQLESRPVKAIPVERDGRLVGLLTQDKVVEFALVGRAVEKHTRSSGAQLEAPRRRPEEERRLVEGSVRDR